MGGHISPSLSHGALELEVANTKWKKGKYILQSVAEGRANHAEKPKGFYTIREILERQ